MRECKKDKRIGIDGYRDHVRARSSKSRRWAKRYFRKRKRQKHKRDDENIYF